MINNPDRVLVKYHGFPDPYLERVYTIYTNTEKAHFVGRAVKEDGHYRFFTNFLEDPSIRPEGGIRLDFSLKEEWVTIVPQKTPFESLADKLMVAVENKLLEESLEKEK